MESIFLSAFMQVVFEKTAALTPRLIRQFKSLWGADVINKEMGKLESTFTTIQAVLEDAEEQQHKNKAVRNWLAKLKEVVYDADDVLDEFHWEVLRQEAEGNNMKDQVCHFFSSENPILFRNRMGSKIKEIVGRLNEIAEERSRFHLSTSSSSINKNQYIETHSFVIQSEVVGREKDQEKIVEMLFSVADRDTVSVLPIVGMGGLGKTTLAQMVYNDPRVKEHFQIPPMWICVSNEFDVKRLAIEILEAAGGKHVSSEVEAAEGKHMSNEIDVKRLGKEILEALERKQHSGSSMDLLQQSLREKLSSGRFLLVLDDVWNDSVRKWEELKVLISHGGKGSAVLVTTRNQGVSSIMGTLNAYNLDLLSEEECWTLFKQRAFVSGVEAPPSLVKIGKEIIKKFGGLPLAAKAVGSFLRIKTSEEEWLSVLNNVIWDLPAGENEILPALRLSYDHLPSNLKACFAFCSIFPKDYDLKEEVLIQLWSANGLIPCNGAIEAEGHKIFNELIARSFLQNVEEYVDDFRYTDDFHNITKVRCKMHDLVHDLAQAITKNECCYILEDGNLGKNQNFLMRHVFLGSKMSTDTIKKATLSFSKSLHTLLGKQTRYNFWLKKAKSLRALQFSSRFPTRLPVSIDKLKHLRYLDLSGNRFEKLPEATTRLFHLQTLNLERCRNLRELPGGMRNLKNLRHLYIHGCNKLSRMPRGMGNLTCLQALTRYAVGPTTSSGSIRELKDLNIGGGLQLCGLNNVKNAEDAKEANLFSKHKLQYASLEWNDHSSEEKSEEVMECLQPHPNITKLEIMGYPVINFPNWMMNCTTHLPNLVKIVLKSCSRCEYLPALGQLRALEFLEIEGIPGVKNFVGSRQSAASHSGGAGGAVEIFPSLKELRLTRLDNLEDLQDMEFPRLIYLTIWYCRKLTTLPHLPSLQFLHIRGCPLLLPKKGFFLKMNYLRSLVMVECHKLAPLLNEVELMDSNPSLGSLSHLGIESCDELISLSDNFMRCLGSLQTLEIGGCKNLVGSSSSSSSSTAIANGGVRSPQLQHLTTLETLEIRDCDKLIGDPLELPQSPRLHNLSLHNCPNIHSLSNDLALLTSLVSLEIKSCGMASLPDGLGCLVALKGLGIVKCNSMPTLPESLGRLTNLTSLTIGSPSLTSLPEVLGGLNQLEKLYIQDSPNLTSLPEGLQQRLPRLFYFCVRHSPILERQCSPGGGVLAPRIAHPQMAHRISGLG